MKRKTISKIVATTLCGIVEIYLFYFILHLGNIYIDLGKPIGLLDVNNQTELIYINSLMIIQNTVLIVFFFLITLLLIITMVIGDFLISIWKPKKK